MGLGEDYKLLETENFDGHTMPSGFAIVKEQIDNFKVRPSDIWVTSYPKSGTTWCQEMVWLVANDLDYEGAKKDLDSRFPYLEARGAHEAMVRFIQKNQIESKLSDMKTCPDVVEILGRFTGKRFIKTHIPWNLLPKQIKNGARTPKIIHIMRDPKQVVASFYSFSLRGMPIYKGNLENFVDAYIKGNLAFGAYFNTVLSYWEQKHLSNVLILTYEEMYENIENAIRKMCQFLNKCYSEEEIRNLAEHLSFERMKDNVAVNKQKFLKSEHVQFMRKGIVDSYKQELTEEMIGKLNEWIKECSRNTELPYEIK